VGGAAPPAAPPAPTPARPVAGRGEQAPQCCYPNLGPPQLFSCCSAPDLRPVRQKLEVAVVSHHSDVIRVSFHNRHKLQTT